MKRIALLLVLYAPISQPIDIYENNSNFDWIGYNNCDFETNGELFIAQQFMKPLSIVFDVGANIGEWSASVLSRVPSINLHAFEPIRFVYDQMSRTLPVSARVHLNNLAVCHQQGQVKFTVYDNNLYMTQLSTMYKRNKDIEDSLALHSHEIIVPTITLDHYCITHNISHIDYLKIDTEGAELDVLKGAKEYLENGRISVIQFEYGGNFLDAHITLQQVFLYLTTNNYQIYRILPNGLLHIAHWDNQLENYCYCNYLAILQ